MDSITEARSNDLHNININNELQSINRFSDITYLNVLRLPLHLKMHEFRYRQNENLFYALKNGFK